MENASDCWLHLVEAMKAQGMNKKKQGKEMKKNEEKNEERGKNKRALNKFQRK